MNIFILLFELKIDDFDYSLMDRKNLSVDITNKLKQWVTKEKLVYIHPYLTTLYLMIGAYFKQNKYFQYSLLFFFKA